MEHTIGSKLGLPSPTFRQTSEKLSTTPDSGVFSSTSSESTFHKSSPPGGSFIRVDPLRWTRLDVANWLEYVKKRYSLPALDKNKFAMNGLGVTLIPKRGFVKRLGQRGELVHKDFRSRLWSFHTYHKLQPNSEMHNDELQC